MARRVEFLSSSIEETKRYGFEIGKKLSPNSVLVFLGDLGAGKTTFIKGVVKALGRVAEDEVNSPTFVYLNCYNTPIPVYHFDLYRLKSSADFIAMGFLDYLQNGGITLIEWGERITDIIPANAWIIEILHERENSRRLSITCEECEKIQNLTK